MEWPETTWNNLKRPTTSKKRPETSKKQPEMTYNGHGTTWNELQLTWCNFKRPAVSKKWPEMTYNEQETTWNDPQRVRYNLKWPKLIYNKQKNFGNVVHCDMNFFIKLFTKHEWKQHSKRHFFLFLQFIARAVILVAESLRLENLLKW